MTWRTRVHGSRAQRGKRFQQKSQMIRKVGGKRSWEEERQRMNSLLEHTLDTYGLSAFVRDKINKQLFHFASLTHDDSIERGGYVTLKGDVVPLTLKTGYNLQQLERQIFFDSDATAKIKQNGGIIWHSHHGSGVPSSADRAAFEKAVKDRIVKVQIVTGLGYPNERKYVVSYTASTKEGVWEKRYFIPY